MCAASVVAEILNTRQRKNKNALFRLYSFQVKSNLSSRYFTCRPPYYLSNFSYLFCAYISVPLRFGVVETEKLLIALNQLVATFVDQQMFNGFTFGTIKLRVNTRVLKKHISSCLSQLFLDSFPFTEIWGSFPGKIDQKLPVNNSETSELSNFCTFFHGRTRARPENFKASGVFGALVCSKFKSFGRGVLILTALLKA